MPGEKYTDLYRATVYWMRRRGHSFVQITRLLRNPSQYACSCILDRMSPEQEDICIELESDATRIADALRLRDAGVSMGRIAALHGVETSALASTIAEHFPDCVDGPAPPRKKPDPLPPPPKHTCAYLVVTPHGVEPCGEGANGTYCKPHRLATAPHGNRFKDMSLGRVVV